VDSLLSSLSRDTVRAKSSKPVVTEGPAILATSKASLERVDRILKNLDRCVGPQRQGVRLSPLPELSAAWALCTGPPMRSRRSRRRPAARWRSSSHKWARRRTSTRCAGCSSSSSSGGGIPRQGDPRRGTLLHPATPLSPAPAGRCACAGACHRPDARHVQRPGCVHRPRHLHCHAHRRPPAGGRAAAVAAPPFNTIPPCIGEVPRRWLLLLLLLPLWPRYWRWRRSLAPGGTRPCGPPAACHSSASPGCSARRRPQRRYAAVR
jgi:hypothetical protein